MVMNAGASRSQYIFVGHGVLEGDYSGDRQPNRQSERRICKHNMGGYPEAKMSEIPPKKDRADLRILRVSLLVGMTRISHR
jgi:hypothetical protein